MKWRQIGFSDLLIFVLLVVIGVVLLRSHDIMKSAEAIATLVGGSSVAPLCCSEIGLIGGMKVARRAKSWKSGYTSSR